MSAEVAALESELGRYTGPIAPADEPAARVAFLAL